MIIVYRHCCIAGCIIALIHFDLLANAALQPFVESWTYNSHTVNVVLGYCEQGDLGTIMLKRKISRRFLWGTLPGVEHEALSFDIDFVGLKQSRRAGLPL
eukprot:scaffold135944_cov17-Tisochrysis_lutea.AAC.1